MLVVSFEALALYAAPNIAGLTGLSLAELGQIAVCNNLLLLRGLWLCIPMALQGGAVLLEHPAPPHESDRPAIWRTGLVLLLLREGWLFKRHTFRQGHFGATDLKPTTLMYAHCPISQVLAENADKERCDQYEELIGRDERGLYRTSKAKEYPSNLCMCFALAVWRAVQSRHLPASTDQMDPLAQHLETLSGRVDLAQTMLPDYQPQGW